MPMHGYKGRAKTLERVLSDYYFLGIAKLVKKVVSKYYVYSMAKTLRYKLYRLL